jgi:hypothetical protein
MKILKVEQNDINDYSVLIEDGKIKVWVDVWKDDETDVDFRTEWNKYIFDLTDCNDLAIRVYQDNIENFMYCMELVEEHILNLLN